MFQWGEERLKRLSELHRKMLQLECVPCVKQLDEYSLLVKQDMKKENVPLAIRNLTCSIKLTSASKKLPITF